MGIVDEHVHIQAPPAIVWAILADYGAIATWNPLLRASRLVGTVPGGVGAVRHCDIRAGGYTKERVATWTEAQALAWDVIETDTPMKRATNGLLLMPEGGGTRVTFHLDYELRGGPLGRLMDLLVAGRKMREAARTTLGGLKARAESGATRVQVQAGPAMPPAAR